MATTNQTLGPRMMRTSNTPLYWGVAILAAVIIVLALLMKPTKVGHETTLPTSYDQQVDSATGQLYSRDSAKDTLKKERPNIDPNMPPARD